MPLYQIRCTDCGHEEEIVRKLAEYAHPMPVHCSSHMVRVPVAPRVMSDIEPYRAAAADKETGERPMITSRSHHREFLHRNGYAELGNDPIRPRKQLEPDKHEIGRTIKRVMDEKGIVA